MALERLWAGWRTEYIDTVIGEGEDHLDACLFCALPDVEPDEALVIVRDEHAYAVLNAYPYTSGHLMVVPVRHVGELDELRDDEAHQVMAMTQAATTAIRAAYAPQGMNVGMNLGRAAGAGIPGHLHVHVLPRWGGDTNFMTSVAESRVLPEPLSKALERLRAAWPSAGARP
ncbi:MAG TPA: HIT domain-containing protein [Acidimicrobiia bacterium]|nr:HIT domain-containing protein [Acidimicrobiia bacterium]